MVEISEPKGIGEVLSERVICFFERILVESTLSVVCKGEFDLNLEDESDKSSEKLEFIVSFLLLGPKL